MESSFSEDLENSYKNVSAIVQLCSNFRLQSLWCTFQDLQLVKFLVLPGNYPRHFPENFKLENN